jgi:hypothetical protein
MALELDAAASSSAETPTAADPGAVSSTGPAPEAQPAAAQGEKPPETPVAAATAPATPDPKEGRVVELSRGKRAAETERDSYKGKITELEGELGKWKPLIDLVGLASTDPIEWITQMADASGLSAERVQEAIATRGAGGKPTLSVEEKVAALERQIRERDEKAEKTKAEADKTTADAAYVETKRHNVGETVKFLANYAKDFPAAEAVGQEAAEAIYEFAEARWGQLKAAGNTPTDQAGVLALYREGAARVNKILAEQAERIAPKLGYQRQQAPAGGPPAPQSFRGLSSEQAGHASPPADRDRVNSAEEIDAIAARMFGGTA